MATSSKFIQLSSSVLLEYIYADNSQINVPGNQYRISTTNAPIWEMQNSHTNIPQILNSDSSEKITPNSPIGTGNARNRSFAQISASEIALLDIDKLLPYNDYDVDLTNTSNLPIAFTNPQAPVYDTVRLHLVQGFNFEQNEGLALSIKAKKKNDKGIILGNLVYNKTDIFETLNPSSFFFGGRVYDSYVDFRVLSLYQLQYDYWLGTLTGDTVVERITQGLGVANDQQIQVFFYWIKSYKTVDEQTYGYVDNIISVDLPTQDQFESISAYIANSSTGDYIEFYGKYNSAIIEQFILDLNRSGFDYILLHDLVISEYVNDGSGNYGWVKTDDLQISQTTEFDKPNVYRPVIKNSSATSFKIDYVLRLYNREDNSQVWKTSSIISFDTQKYGKKIGSINLGTNPVRSTIFNKKYTKEITIKGETTPVQENTKYITSFLDASNISISFGSVNLEETSTESNALSSESPISNNRDFRFNSKNSIGDINKPTLQKKSPTSNIYSNGLAKILIPDSTSFLKFTIYQKGESKTNIPLNISGIGDLSISFKSDSGDEISISEYPTTATNATRGEIIFKLTQEQSKNILGLSNRTFRIYLINEKKEKTFLYSGKYYSTEEWMNLSINDKISSLNKVITTLRNNMNNLTKTVRSQSETIDVLNSKISSYNKALASSSAENLEDDERIRILTDNLDSNVNEIERLNKIIGELTELLDTQQNQQLQDEGLNDSISVRPKPTRVGTTPVKIIPSPSYYENISKGNQASIVRGTSEAMTPIKIIPQPGRVTGNNAPISDLFFSEAPRLPGTGFGNFGGGGEPSR